jgi:aminoglycoside phosphotransferase (APT) family kinase protein
MAALEISTEVFEVPRGWKQSIHEYLEGYNLRCNKATAVQGGNSAYVWRIEGLQTIHGESLAKSTKTANEVLILKYGESQLKSGPLQMSPDRMQWETRAMTSAVVARACAQEPAVEVPRVVTSTKEAVIMSWAGNRDLLSAYSQDPSLDAAYIGASLGRWLAAMHLTSIDDAEVKDWTNATASMVEEMERGNMLHKLAASGEFTQHEIDQASALHQTISGVRTLVAWDFRPMNTLLRDGASPSRPRVTVVDWEVSCYTDPAFDIRLWVAEAMVLEAKHGANRGLLKSFLSAYRRTAGERIVTEEFVYKTAVLVGALWMLLMPATIWDCTEADREPWMQKAKDYIRAGINGDRTWLLKSSIAPLL